MVDASLAGDGFSAMALYCEKGEDDREDAMDWIMEMMEIMERIEKNGIFNFQIFKI